MSEENFGTFVRESGVELGRVVAAAADLPRSEPPEVGTVRSERRAFCYAATKAWQGFGEFPITSDSDLMSPKAAGFMCAHDCLAAERALCDIMRRKGKNLESLGRQSWELALAGTYREIVDSGRLCSGMEWEEAFTDQRKRLPAGIVVTLSLEEREDGKYQAKAGVRLDCVHFGFCDMAHIEREVQSVEEIRQIAREALGEVFPWVLSEEMGKRIEERDAGPIRLAIEERKEANLPDIPRWITEMAETLIRDIPGKDFPVETVQTEPVLPDPAPDKPNPIRMGM